MDFLKQLRDLFQIKVSKDKLEAEIWYNDENGEAIDEWQWSEEDIMAFVKAANVTYGLILSNIESLVHLGFETAFPLTIAKGYPAQNGEDGEMQYNYDTTTVVDRSEGFDFREVMRIPTVQADEKIAMLIPPTEGEDGRSVYDNILKAIPGKPVNIKAGKNVTFNKEDLSFNASIEGQVSTVNRTLHVHHVYEVTEDLSLKIGNINFLGSVVIYGNVPTGFSVKATGDIKVFGLTEGAELHSGGSVFISEGMVGIQQGSIQAEEDIYMGYINQGNVTAGNNLYVDRSILHSHCTAVKSINCQTGNIIGGSLSAGESIIAKNVGNRMNTVTELSLGVDKELYNRQHKLEEEKKVSEDSLKKLTLLKEKLQESKKLDTKQRITQLKVRNSFEQTNEKIKEIDHELTSISSSLGTIDQTFLSVMGTIFINTIVSFGKYRRTIDKNFDNVTVRLNNNEINII